MKVFIACVGMGLLIFSSSIYYAVSTVADDIKTSHKNRIITQQYCETVTITKIGGCNSNGWCGVVLSDKSKGIDLYPVLGENCEEFTFR